MTKKELVKKENGALAKPQARGYEEGSREDELLIPRAKLTQGMTPEVLAGQLTVGKIVNSITLEALPPEFVPIFKSTNWVRFNPRDQKHPAFNPAFPAGGVIWRSADPQDEKVLQEAKFGPNGELPLATKFINFFSLFPGVPMPIVVSFAKTSLKAGKQLLSLARFLGGDLFSHKFSLKAKLVQNAQGTFYVFDVAKIGVPSAEEFAQAESWWQEFHAKDVKIHEEESEVTEETRPY